MGMGQNLYIMTIEGITIYQPAIFGGTRGYQGFDPYITIAFFGGCRSRGDHGGTPSHHPFYFRISEL
jgi:hypothetical protein